MRHLPIEDESAAGDAWIEVVPMLDHALDALPEKDRQVIFLRYFDGMSFEQMARQFGGEPAAWRQRGSRAVERLRGSLAKRGVTVGATTIAAGLGTTLSQTAPASFIASAGAAHAAVATLSWKTLALHSLHLMKMKPALVISAVLLVSFVPLGSQANAISSVRQRVAAMETEIGPLAGGAGMPQRRSVSSRKQASSKTNLVALADSLLAAEQGDALRNLLMERKLQKTGADELEQMLMETLETEMGTAQRSVLIRSLFRELSRIAEKSKMPCEKIIALAAHLDTAIPTGQGNVWNSANPTIARWMKTDLDAAVVWFREARKNGGLDDVQGTPNLAGQIFNALHGRNPGDALKFYQSLPDNERQAVIGGGGGRDEPELMLDLAAGIGDEQLRGAALAQVFSSASGKTPEEVRGWIDRIAPHEYKAVELLAHAARGQNRVVSTPEMLDRIDWLREACKGRDFSHAAGIFLAEVARIDRGRVRGVVEAEWARNPDERMLANYLCFSFFSNEAVVVDAIPLSQRITDADMRDDALRRLLLSSRGNEDARLLARKGGLSEEDIARLIPENP